MNAPIKMCTLCIAATLILCACDSSSESEDNEKEDAGECIPSCEDIVCGQLNSCGTDYCQEGSGCVGECTPSCEGIPCGELDSCGQNVCSEGEGCCNNSCEGVACGWVNDCGTACNYGSGCCDSTCPGYPNRCGGVNECGNPCPDDDDKCAGVACGAENGCGTVCNGSTRKLPKYGSTNDCKNGADCGCGTLDQWFHDSWRCGDHETYQCKINAGYFCSHLACLGVNASVRQQDSLNAWSTRCALAAGCQANSQHEGELCWPTGGQPADCWSLDCPEAGLGCDP